MGLSKKIEIKDILEAKNNIYGVVPKTLFTNYKLFNEFVGADVYFKHENYNITHAFKIRGVTHFLKKSALPELLIAATKGNHGAAIAYAASLFRKKSIVVVPKNNSKYKNDLIRSYGAQLVEFGDTFDDANEYAQNLGKNKNSLFIHIANDKGIVAGAGTVAFEIFDKCYDLDYLLQPIGGGSGISGSIIARNTLSKKTKVFGVQAENANALYLSLRKNKKVSLKNVNTIADGLATKNVFDLTYNIIKKDIDDVLLVSEKEIKEALKIMFFLTGNIIETASATSIAALIKNKGKFFGKKIAIIITGSNLDPLLFLEIINEN